MSQLLHSINVKKMRCQLTVMNFSGSSVVDLLDFRDSAWVLIVKPLFRLCLLYEAPTCGALLVLFSKGAGFGFCLLLAASPSGRRVCFYSSDGDLPSLLDMLEEFHCALLLLVLVDYRD